MRARESAWKPSRFKEERKKNEPVQFFAISLSHLEQGEREGEGEGSYRSSQFSISPLLSPREPENIVTWSQPEIGPFTPHLANGGRRECSPEWTVNHSKVTFTFKPPTVFTCTLEDGLTVSSHKTSCSKFRSENWLVHSGEPVFCWAIKLSVPACLLSATNWQSCFKNRRSMGNIRKESATLSQLFTTNILDYI